MESIFEYSNYNGDISNWDVSNVTNMADMFFLAKEFNQAIGNWDVSNVTNMKRLFNGATSFNQDISKWDVSKVITMDYMFANTKKFNQNISNWNLEKIRLCEDMFDNANAFLDKYNDGEELPYHTDHIIEWIINNREKMNLISIKDMHGKEIDGFFHAIRFYSQNRNR